jgi:NAD(P)-dependent dehydrogenase (short-subunit alcohol dehydrogenase family)
VIAVGQVRTAIVTGAAKGLGAGIAGRLASDGLSVVCVDVLDPEPVLASLPVRDGAAHMAVVCDVSDTRAVERVVADVLERDGRVDVLVNNAAVLQPIEPVVATADEVLDRVLAVNLRGTLAFSRAVGTSMIDRRSGRIVNISSQVGKAPWPGHGVYAASKAGVIALTQAMALEVAQYGVYVNCICPGTMDTDQMRGGFRYRAEKLGVSVESLIAEERDAIPLGRLGQPEDAAAMVAWLASEEASFSTGAVFNLTGGQCTGF